MEENQVKHKRIFIFDPCFGGITGHWENYCKRFYNEVENKGYLAKIYGQKRFSKDIIGDTQFEPLFSYSSFEAAPDVDALYQYSRLFLADFGKIKEDEFMDGDLLVFHSIYPQTFGAIADWLKELASRKKIIAAIFLQFPPSKRVNELRRKMLDLSAAWKLFFLKNRKNQQIMPWEVNHDIEFYKQSAEKLHQLISNKTCFIFSNTKMLAEGYSALFSETVHCLPMPGPQVSSTSCGKSLSGQERKVVNNNMGPYPKIKFGYFGHASLEKGGQFLTYLVEKTLAIYPHAEFILHLNSNKDTEASLNSFKEKTYPNVECHFGHISQEKMLKLMDEVDIILLPYSPIKYANTPSAIFTEGMILKKSFVIPYDSWIYQEAKEYNSGFVYFKKYTKSAILKAMLNAIVNFSELKEKAIVSGDKFRNYHNISNYVDIFLRIVEGESLSF